MRNKKDTSEAWRELKKSNNPRFMVGSVVEIYATDYVIIQIYNDHAWIVRHNTKPAPWDKGEIISIEELHRGVMFNKGVDEDVNK